MKKWLSDYISPKKEIKKIIIFLIILLNIVNIQSLPNFKTIYLSGNYYYMITQDKINYYCYNDNGDTTSITYEFTYEQKISTIEESKMISFGTFRNNPDVANLLIVKHFVYAVTSVGGYFCNGPLYEIQGYESEVYGIKCLDNYCYYIVGIINSSSQLALYLYKNPSSYCDSHVNSNIIINNIDSDNFSCELMKSSSYQDILTCFYKQQNTNQIIAQQFNININTDSTSITTSNSKTTTISNGAKIIKSTLSGDYTKSLVCYINNDKDGNCLIYNIITNEWSDSNNYLNDCLSDTSSLNIEYFDNSNEYILYCFQSSTKFNLMTLNQNFEIQEVEENGIYDLTDSLNECNEYYVSSLMHNSNNINMFISCDNNIMKHMAEKAQNLPTTIITTILTTLPATTIITTLPATTIITTFLETTILTTLPATTIITTQPATTILTTLPATTIITTSPETSILTTLPETTIVSTQPVTTILTTLPATTIITTSPETSILTTIPAATIFSTMPSLFITSNPTITKITNNKVENDLGIIQEKSTKKKEEIIDNLDKVMEDYDIGKIYEIFGDDYSIKISPINSKKSENISTYIDFGNCENILREKNKLNSTSVLTVYQIEIDNTNEQSLINDVEYAVFNEKKEKLDLSVCDNELIEINYQINTSMINKTKIAYYNDLGIDVFNIKDKFFNDICYSYSEGDSDLILDDRVSDIYQNFSICENNCDYNKINLTENTVSCKCTIKTSFDAEVKPPKLDKIIRDSFVYSNIAVMKCYNLVFSIKNKFENYGFIIFTILVFLHIPFFIYYFIFNITPIKKFIFTEMNKFHYFNNINNPTKKDKKKMKFKKKKKALVQISKFNRESSETMVDKKAIKEKYKESTSSRLNLFKIKNKNTNNKINKNSKIKIKNNENNIGVLNDNRRKKNKNLQPVLVFDCKVLNKNYINANHGIEIKSTKNNFPTLGKKNSKKEKTILSSKIYSLIHIDANNSTNKKPPSSDFLLDNYDYETAIKYDNRSFWRIFYINIVAKENIVNIILFKTPLDLNSLRICLFIFTYSCDLAFNTIFYSTQNISDKYHYEGDDLFLFTIINNLVQSILSAVVGLILVNILQHMIDSRGNYEDIFRNEEKKMRKNNNYKVNKVKKNEIFEKIRKISLKLKCKIVLFIFIEFIIMVFFYYFVTAFCEVYKKTQKSWIIDFFTSFIISFTCEIFGAFIISILYILSLRYRLKFIYRIVIFFYSL